MRRASFWLSLAGLGAAAGWAPTAPVVVLRAEPPAYWKMPWGVADARGAWGFVTNPAGGIDALDLATSKVLWSTAEAHTPVALAGRDLVALVPDKVRRNALRVVTFDVEDRGRRPRVSDAVVFPDWVSVSPAPGRSFTTQAWVDGDKLLLRWDARGWYAGAARRTPEIEKAARRSASGVARVDLRTGGLEMFAAEKAPAPPAPRVPEAVLKSFADTPGPAEEDAPRLLVSRDLATAPVVERAPGGGQRLVLARWDPKTWKPLLPRRLMDGAELNFVPAPDAAAVLARRLPRDRGDSRGDSDWHVFSTETGKELGRFPAEKGAGLPTVLGPRAYYVTTGAFKPARGTLTAPRTLKALDLRLGKVVWEHPIAPLRRLAPAPSGAVSPP
jgi:hypothetical protein